MILHHAWKNTKRTWKREKEKGEREKNWKRNVKESSERSLTVSLLSAWESDRSWYVTPLKLTNSIVCTYTYNSLEKEHLWLKYLTLCGHLSMIIPYLWQTSRRMNYKEVPGIQKNEKNLKNLYWTTPFSLKLNSCLNTEFFISNLQMMK